MDHHERFSNNRLSFMRLPRRVPWADISEFEEICTWIYSNEDDTTTKIQAVNRLSAWKVNTVLPHALDTVHSLLIAILEDEEYSNATSDANTRRSSALGLRQSYSLALIRMVNGLVDPLQQGAYARSIASIAGQIGLPMWLVELRHVSTHEDLPSLELLREGAREAMSWLLHNYFLPTLSPLSQPTRPIVPLSPISPLMTQYKQLMKSITRDVSLKSRSGTELNKTLRAFDNWVSEAKVAASMVTFDVESNVEEEEARERWAIEQVCDALIGRGGLVPVSKRKRPSPLQVLSVPSAQYVSMWSPLLLHLQSHYPTFPSILSHRILSKLLPFHESTNADEPSAPDPTYDHTLASWLLWTTEQWRKDSNSKVERKDVIKHILLGLSRSDNKAARTLLSTITDEDPQLQETVTLLSSALQSSSRTAIWDEDALSIMSQRLSSLKTETDSNLHGEDVEMSDASQALGKDASDGVRPLKGWRLLTVEDGWKPCPIGVFVGGR